MRKWEPKAPNRDPALSSHSRWQLFAAGEEYFFLLFFFEVIDLSKNIYVGNLPWSTTDNDLRDLFSQYGEVSSAHVIEDRETGRSRGFGFVEMDEEGARKSIQALNGSDMQGRSLKVNEAQPRESRPASRSRY
jgi:RNA recognition motif-containing protein